MTGSNEAVGSQQVGERVIVEPTGESVVEPFGLSSKATPVLPIAESSTQSSKASETYDEEAETVKSVGSDQSDEIETRSINGDGGDYVLLGTTESPPLTESTERGSPQGIDILPLPRELQVTLSMTTISARHSFTFSCGKLYIECWIF